MFVYDQIESYFDLLTAIGLDIINDGKTLTEKLGPFEWVPGIFNCVSISKFYNNYRSPVEI